MNYKIIVDSGADLPQKIVDEYDVCVIPIPYIINDVTYIGTDKMTSEEFYTILDDMSNDVKTCQINPQMYEEVFEKYIKEGYHIVYLALSSGITATLNSAHIAKELLLERYPDAKITLIDSKCASVGFGLYSYKLIQMQKNGAPLEVIIEAADFYSKHLRHILTVNTLAYLIKGGRLSKFTGGVATMLSIKPVITVDGEGKLVIYKLVRGKKASHAALVNFIVENGYNTQNQTMSIAHGEDWESYNMLKSLLLEQVSPKELMENIVGNVIGTHVGRGILGIVFCDASEEKFEKYLNK